MEALPGSMEALLGREPAAFSPQQARACVEGQVILITGAAGSVGSELCRQIAALQPSALIAFDQAESPLVALESELAAHFPALRFHPQLGSVTNLRSVRGVMEQYRPAIVFHGAALKHVPLLEGQLIAAVETNILGTLNVARAAAGCGVRHCILISTDKATRPAGIMGVTKRVAELVLHSLSANSRYDSGTRFAAVRFGNVLGSSGSVVPIFAAQIAAGGPVTVTHPGMMRYFMTAREAAQLLLGTLVLGTLASRHDAQTFVLDMGQPISILRLAKDLIHRARLNRPGVNRLGVNRPDQDGADLNRPGQDGPGQEIEIAFTGIRPGEKLVEEIDADHLRPTAHPGIRCLVESLPISEDRLRSCLATLEQSFEARDSSAILAILQTLVPDYCPGRNVPSENFPIKSEPEAGFGFVDSDSSQARSLQLHEIAGR